MQHQQLLKQANEISAAPPADESGSVNVVEINTCCSEENPKSCSIQSVTSGPITPTPANPDDVVDISAHANIKQEKIDDSVPVSPNRYYSIKR